MCEMGGGGWLMNFNMANGPARIVLFMALLDFDYLW